MLSFDETRRIIQLRERVRTSTYEAMKGDGHHKSGEGSVSVSFCLPNIFDGDTPSWLVGVYSYVLGPNRNHIFHGKTLPEALAKAEDAVGEWCMPWEMRMFEREAGIEDGPPE